MRMAYGNNREYDGGNYIAWYSYTKKGKNGGPSETKMYMIERNQCHGQNTPRTNKFI